MIVRQVGKVGREIDGEEVGMSYSMRPEIFRKDLMGQKGGS